MLSPFIMCRCKGRTMASTRPFSPPPTASCQLPTANRQPPPTMVEHMECPWAFLGKLVPEHFFFVPLRTALVATPSHTCRDPHCHPAPLSKSRALRPGPVCSHRHWSRTAFWTDRGREPDWPKLRVEPPFFSNFRRPGVPLVGRPLEPTEKRGDGPGNRLQAPPPPPPPQHTTQPKHVRTHRGSE